MSEMNELQDLHEELLSALFDDETNEFETRRILQELSGEDKQRFQRYQLINDAVNNKLEPSVLTIDVSAAVSAAIADEPTPKPDQATSDSNLKHEKKYWIKPLVGFAAAASVAFVAVFSLQQGNGVLLGEPALNTAANSKAASDTQSPSSFVADGNVQASQLQIQSGVGLSAVSGTAELPLRQTISEINEQKRKEQERLNYFFNQHAQQSSFNNNRGLLPMVRMAGEEGQ
jgi:sigma-E factor negative regulatory protein RseA